jgi:hypothetical protein
VAIETIVKTETITKEITEARAVICDGCGERTLLTLNQKVDSSGEVWWGSGPSRIDNILVRRISQNYGEESSEEIFHVCPRCWDSKVKGNLSQDTMPGKQT